MASRLRHLLTLQNAKWVVDGKHCIAFYYDHEGRGTAWIYIDVSSNSIRFISHGGLVHDWHGNVAERRTQYVRELRLEADA